MRRSAILLFLITAGSVLCWLPSILEPSLDLPTWVPLTVIALSVGLATILSGGRWLRFLVVSAAATLVGIVAGYTIWPMEDGIAQSYVGLAALAAMFAVALACLVTGLIGRKLSVVNQSRRRAVWILLAACVAFGPVTLALRPSLIAHRVARNDHFAEQRFESLKLAVERTRSQPGGSASICDGRSLKKNYSGPRFSARNWRYIAGNYVQEDGYLFGIWIDCSRPERYTIDVRPVRAEADGSRRFCTNESGRIGCDTQWNRSWGECVPCGN